MAPAVPHRNERGGTWPQRQPADVCMGGFPGLGMGQDRKKGDAGETQMHTNAEPGCLGVWALKKPMSALLMGLTGCGPQDCDTGTWGCNGKVVRSLTTVLER